MCRSFARSLGLACAYALRNDRRYGCLVARAARGTAGTHCRPSIIDVYPFMSPARLMSWTHIKVAPRSKSSPSHAEGSRAVFSGSASEQRLRWWEDSVLLEPSEAHEPWRREWSRPVADSAGLTPAGRHGPHTGSDIKVRGNCGLTAYEDILSDERCIALQRPVAYKNERTADEGRSIADTRLECLIAGPGDTVWRQKRVGERRIGPLPLLFRSWRHTCPSSSIQLSCGREYFYCSLIKWTGTSLTICNRPAPPDGAVATCSDGAMGAVKRATEYSECLLQSLPSRSVS